MTLQSSSNPSGAFKIFLLFHNFLMRIPANRPSRQRSVNEQAPEKQPPHVKLGVVARLRREVLSCPTNKALGVMLNDFVKVTSKSTGRTITKVALTEPSGIAFANERFYRTVSHLLKVWRSVCSHCNEMWS